MLTKMFFNTVFINPFIHLLNLIVGLFHASLLFCFKLTFIVLYVFFKVSSFTVNILRTIFLKNDSGHWSEMILILQASLSN